MLNTYIVSISFLKDIIRFVYTFNPLEFNINIMYGYSIVPKECKHIASVNPTRMYWTKFSVLCSKRKTSICNTCRMHKALKLHVNDWIKYFD